MWQKFLNGFAISEDGNIRSHKHELLLNSSQTLEVKLDWLCKASIPEIHPHIKLEKVKSDTLTKWWGKTIYEHAAVLLPSGYFKNPDIEYPIYYFVGGGDSDYLAAVWQMENKNFADWWMGDDAPPGDMVPLRCNYFTPQHLTVYIATILTQLRFYGCIRLPDHV